MRALLLLAFVPALVLAQHDHHAPARAIVVPKAKDPDHREHWKGAAIAPQPGESVDHASMHALPIGTGAAADGGAWLRPDVTGVYKIHNGQLNEVRNDKGELVKPPFNAILSAGRIYRVMPHKGALEWTLPSAPRKTVVPKENLIAPMTVSSPGAGRPYP